MSARPSDGDARADRGGGTGPIYPPPQPAGLSPVLERNIRALQRRREQEEKGASAEERIMFMTTNHIEKLDDALIRPGRIDMTVQLGNATEWQIGQLWDRFYAPYDLEGKGKKIFVERAKEFGLVDKVSTAQLQGVFLYNKDDPGGAIAMVDQLSTVMHAQDKQAPV